jgi:hypothetical protein
MPWWETVRGIGQSAGSLSKISFSGGHDRLSTTARMWVDIKVYLDIGLRYSLLPGESQLLSTLSVGSAL